MLYKIYKLALICEAARKALPVGGVRGRTVKKDYIHTQCHVRVCVCELVCVCVCEKMLKKGLMRAKQAEAEDSVGLCVRGRRR